MHKLFFIAGHVFHLVFFVFISFLKFAMFFIAYHKFAIVFRGLHQISIGLSYGLCHQVAEASCLVEEEHACGGDWHCEVPEENLRGSL